MWRTTYPTNAPKPLLTYFNPRPPCGGRLTAVPDTAVVLRISIHVPRVEDDGVYLSVCRRVRRFQSTSPVWRTTKRMFRPTNAAYHFNPRPPCGGRRAIINLGGGGERFQSTSPVWRTTCPALVRPRLSPISIHVPRVEDDKNLQM